MFLFATHQVSRRRRQSQNCNKKWKNSVLVDDVNNILLFQEEALIVALILFYCLPLMKTNYGIIEHRAIESLELGLLFIIYSSSHFLIIETLKVDALRIRFRQNRINDLIHQNLKKEKKELIMSLKKKFILFRSSFFAAYCLCIP